MAAPKIQMSDPEVIPFSAQDDGEHNGSLSFSPYAAVQQNGSRAPMVNKSFTKADHGLTAKPKQPTPFSRAFPPKYKELPEKHKAVLSWRPTKKLSRTSASKSEDK